MEQLPLTAPLRAVYAADPVSNSKLKTTTYGKLSFSTL